MRPELGPAVPEVRERDVSSLELLSRLPLHEVRVREHLDGLMVLLWQNFPVVGSEGDCHGCGVLKLEAAVALVVVLVEEDDGLGCGIVDADLFSGLGKQAVPRRSIGPGPAPCSGIRTSSACLSCGTRPSPRTNQPSQS